MAVALAIALVLAGCTATDPGNDAGNTAAQSPESQDRVVLVDAKPGISHLGGSTEDLALKASQAFFEEAPAVLVLGNDDPGTSKNAAGQAGELGIPLLVAPEGASA